MTRTHNRKFAEPAAYKTPERRALMIAEYIRPRQILPLLNALPGEAVPGVVAVTNWAYDLKHRGELVPKKVPRAKPKQRASRAKQREKRALATSAQPPAMLLDTCETAAQPPIETDFSCERAIWTGWGQIVQMAARHMYPLHELADIQGYNGFREKHGLPLVFLKNWGRYAK